MRIQAPSEPSSISNKMIDISATAGYKIYLGMQLLQAISSGLNTVGIPFFRAGLPVLAAQLALLGPIG